MIIDGINFQELETEKYWNFSKTYKGDIKKETKNMFLSGEYYASLKQDGHYARFIKDDSGNMRLQGRSKSVNGEYLNKIEWVPQCFNFFNELPNGTCLIGELYFPNNRGSRKVTTILGCLKDKAILRQNEGEKLHYYVFDCYAWAGKNLINTPYEQRIKYIQNEIANICRRVSYVEPAQYYEGKEAWNKLGEILNSGLEGMVLYKKNGVVDPGKRKARKSLKVKLQIEDTIDVFLTGVYKSAVKEYKGKTSLETYPYWQNIKTGEVFTTNKFKEYISGETIEPVSRHYALNYAGSVQIAVIKDGKIMPVGYISGITDEIRKNIVLDPEQYKGKVYELSCMEVEHIGNEYSFRHAKFVKSRPDKNYMECSFSQIENS